MRLYWNDDEERALLAARLGADEDVGNGELAAAFEAWFNNPPAPAAKPQRRPHTQRPVSQRGYDELQAVMDANRNIGYTEQTTWYGVG